MATRATDQVFPLLPGSLLGISFREYAAVQIMGGILACPEEYQGHCDTQSRAAYAVCCADALIAALNAPKPGD